MEHYCADHRGYGEAFVDQNDGWYICTRDNKRYEHLTATDQFRDENGRFIDPERWMLLELVGPGLYRNGSQSYSYLGDRYVPRLQLGGTATQMDTAPTSSASPSIAPVNHASVTPSAPMAFGPSPLASPNTTGSSSPMKPADASPTAPSIAISATTASATRRASHSAPGKKGKSTHFSNKLPPRVTGAGALAQYDGSSPAKFKRIKPKTERSGLPESLTKALVKEASEDMAAGKPMTAEATAMTASGATLSGTGSQRNHTQAVDNVNTFFAGVMATLTDHGTDAATRETAREDGVSVARSLTRDADVIERVKQRLDEVMSDEDSDDAAATASELGRATADHRHNVGIGHDGRNMAMSNRPDVTTSPDRTHIVDRDADILDELEGPFIRQLGDELGTHLVTVPTSPGGQHYMSSKTLQSSPSDAAAASLPTKKPDGDPPTSGGAGAH